MSKDKITEADIVAAGAIESPLEPGKLVPLADLLPTAGMDVGTLEAGALQYIGLSIRLGRMQTVAIWLAGQWFAVLRSRLKATEEWMAWQARHKLDDSTVNRAIHLAERVSLERVKDMGATDAYKAAGIIKSITLEEEEEAQADTQAPKLTAAPPQTRHRKQATQKAAKPAAQAVPPVPQAAAPAEDPTEPLKAGVTCELLDPGEYRLTFVSNEYGTIIVEVDREQIETLADQLMEVMGKDDACKPD